MIEATCRKLLMDLARGHAKATGLSLATVSRRVHGSFDFLDDFQAGRCSVTLKKYDEMVAKFGGAVKVAGAGKAAVKNGRKS